MKTLKKVLCLLALLLWTGSIVCGIILFIKTKALVVFLSFLVLAFLSIPGASKLYEALTE